MSQIKKILVLSANPKDTARLRLDEEVREIEEGLRRSKDREHFSISSRLAVNLRELRRALLDDEPQIVHFCGHGEENGIVVEDEHGNATLVDVESLAGLFELFTDQIECVLLNACYSEKQSQEIRKHINYVIGMSKGIQDKTAIEFAVGFYDALGAGKSIEEAFKFGCNAIRLYSLPDYLTPVLRTAITTQELKQENQELQKALNVANRERQRIEEELTIYQEKLRPIEGKIPIIARKHIDIRGSRQFLKWALSIDIFLLIFMIVMILYQTMK